MHKKQGFLLNTIKNTSDLQNSLTQKIRDNRKSYLLFFLCVASFLTLLYFISTYNYLLYHTIVELLTVSVAVAMFLIVWNSREFAKNSYMAFIGIAFLFIGSLDLLHTLAYKGMGIFQKETANLPTQLWIASRYMHAATFFLAPFFVRKKIKQNLLFLIYLLVTTLILMSIFYWENFPDCFVAGSGLTTFKNTSEYIICGLFLAAIFLLFKNRQMFNRSILMYLTLSISFSISSEVLFTFYNSVFAGSIVTGHLFKIAAFYCLYRALIKTQLTQPYRTLFKDLKNNELIINKALDSARKRTSELEIFLSCARSHLVVEKFEKSAEVILQNVIKLLNADCASINMQDKFKEEYTDVNIPSDCTSVFNQNKIQIKLLHDQVLEKKQNIIKNNINLQTDNSDFKNIIALPVIIDNRVCAIVTVTSGRNFNANQESLLSAFVELLSLSLRDFQKTRQLYKEFEKRKHILETIPDPMYIVNKDYEIEYANPAMEKTFGKINGRKCYKYLNDYDRPCSQCAYKDILDNKIKRWEYHCPKNNRIYDAIEAPFKQYGSDDISKLKIIRDITEQRHTRQLLQKSTSDLNFAQEVANLGSWRLNVQKNELEYSDQNHRIFGIPMGSQMTYETFLEKVHPRDREYVNQKWQQALKGKHYDIEHRIIVDGKIKWVRERAELEFDENGKLLGGFGTTQDITDKKNYELKINNLAKFPSENPFPVLRIYKDGKITQSNKSGEILLRFLKLKIGQKVNKSWQELIDKALETQQIQYIEIKFENKNISYAITPIKEAGYVNLYGRDITEFRNAEKKLQSVNTELETRVKDRTIQLQKAVDALQLEVMDRLKAEKKLLENQNKLRDLSSELIIAEEREKREFAQTLHDSIGQMLAFSKKELGAVLKTAPQKVKHPLQDIWNNIKEAVRQTRTLTFDLSSQTLYTLGLEPAIEEMAEDFAQKNNFKLNFKSRYQLKDLPEQLKILLYRTVRELLINIAKHSNARNVEIDISQISETSIQIAVKDDGKGFDKNKIHATKGSRPNFGLFSLRERINNIGGCVNIDSQKGSGTEIVLIVPKDI